MAGGPVASTRTRVARRSSDHGSDGGGALRPEEVEGVTGDGQVPLGGHRGQPEGEGRVAGDVGRPGQDHLVLGHPDARVARAPA